MSRLPIVAMLGTAIGLGVAVLASGASSLSITAPANGGRTADNTPAISGTASTAAGHSDVTVTIFEGAGTGGAQVGGPLTAVRDDNGDWTVDAPTLAPDGEYTAHAEQDVGSGSMATDDTTFTVDTTAPGVTLDAIPTPTSDPTPAFSGNAGDDVGDDATVTVTIYEGSTTGGPVAQTLTPTRTGTSWTDSAANLADGTYTAQGTQADDLGHTGASTAQTFTVDTVGPAVTLDPVTSPTNNDTPAFSGAAGDDVGDATTVTVTIYNGSGTGGAIAQTLTTTRTGASWSDTAAHLADGTYTVEATQQDAAGNTGSSTARTLVVDRTPPVVTLDSPPSRTSDPTPTLQGTAGDTAGDDLAVTLTIYQGSGTGGPVVQTLTHNRTGGSWSDTPTALTDGTYTARATQSDAVGNTGSSLARTFTVDTQAPTTTIEQPGPGSSTNDTTPALSGQGGTADGDLPSVTVTLFNGVGTGGTLKLVPTPVALDGDGSWQIGAPTLTPGLDYTLRVRQVDDLGNETLLTRTFSVDKTAPVVTLTAPVGGSSTNAATPTFAGTAGTAVGDDGVVTVRLYAGTGIGGAPVQTLGALVGGGGAWSVTASSPLAPGTYTAQAEQADAADNHGVSALRTFRINGAPAASFVATPGAPLTGDTISLVSTSSDADGGIASTAWDLDGNGTFGDAGGATASTSFASAGRHVVSVQVTDGDGAVAVASQAITVTQRIVPPAAIRLLSPFPVVRIAGRATTRGARLRLLTVRAPVGARIEVRCRGRGCPVRRVARRAAAKGRSTTRLMSFPQFLKNLRAGIVLEIRVSKTGQIGKFTRFVIRKRKAPARTDSCLKPGSSKPAACPSS